MLFGCVIVILICAGKMKHVRGSELSFISILIFSYVVWYHWFDFVKKKVYSEPKYWPPHYYRKGHWMVD